MRGVPIDLTRTTPSDLLLGEELRLLTNIAESFNVMVSDR